MKLNFLSKSRGIRNLIARIRAVLRRFGITPGKFEKLLQQYSSATNRLGCIPTFPIPAVILKRNKKSVRKILQQGVELAIHGYVHIDYGKQPREKQATHYKKAIDTFNACNVPFTGFRAPFLRTNSDTVDALDQSKFIYNSSQAVHWNVLDKSDYTDASWLEYQRLLYFYQSRPAQDYPVMPRSNNGIIEIPVSIPDDEAMVERLGIGDEKSSERSTTWTSIP